MRAVSDFPIVNYQQTNPLRLLHCAEKLHQCQFFHRHLTPPQLIVLNACLSVEPRSKRCRTWEELMNTNVHLVVKKRPDTQFGLSEGGDEGEAASAADSGGTVGDGYVEEANIDGTLESVSQEDANEEMEGDSSSSKIQTKYSGAVAPDSGETKKLGHENEEQDLSEFDLENLQEHMSGTDFAGNLALKVRYVLWENAVDQLFGCYEETESGFLFHEEPSEEELETEIETLSSKNEVRDVGPDRGEEDDDYDMDEEDPAVEEESQVLVQQDTPDLEYDSDGFLILSLEISKETLTTLSNRDTQAIMESFNKIYHSFEGDKETLLKRLKLEQSDKMLESSKKRRYSQVSEDDEVHKQNEQDQVSDSGDKKTRIPESPEKTISVNLGSANFSLKHLLSSIQDNKAKLGISDYELRHLIMDVRKNRSKWASDDRIGQEELYDACEKVVLELRNYTEHSTAFLNRVSKREAPNYYQIIKKPMDLNTILKKLKTFQYNSKQDFVEDLRLIWKNCLTYNSDPKHFLRAHAIAMQKKSLTLIPLIPDIVIRDRAEVEKEFEDIDNENLKDGLVDEETSGTGRKGGNVRGIVHENDEVGKINGSNSVEDKPKTSPKTLPEEDNQVEEPDGRPEQETDREHQELSKAPGIAQHDPEVIEKFDSEVQSNDGDDLQDGTKELQKVAGNEAKHVEGEEEENDDEEEEEEEEEEGEEGLESGLFLTEKDDDADDLELSTWKSLTATARADMCAKRAGLFKGPEINHEALAILRNPSKMKGFDQILKEYHEQQEAEVRRRELENESMMKNGFGAIVKTESEDLPQSQLLPSANNSASEIDKSATEIELDDASVLMEYNVANAVPEVTYKGLDNETLDKEESLLVQKVLLEGDKMPNVFALNTDKGLSNKTNRNIQLIQEVRHICHKISLIRMLQNPGQQAKSNTGQTNSQIWDTHRYRYTSINENMDIDPVSKLETHDYKNDKQVVWRIMHKNVSKIAMSSGFESTQPSAINMLTEIAGEYISNLIKTVKNHHEGNSLNHKTSGDILKMSLLENGINKPDDLYSYVESEFVKKTKKLQDIKFKLNNFLKDLLRPTLQDLSEKNFDDESQSFLTGDFSSELSGEDFFGFKDLGLDREFGVLSNSVPLQLLTFQFRGKGAEATVEENRIQPEEFNEVVYQGLSEHDIENSVWNTLQPLLKKALERSKAYTSKLQKSKLQDGEGSAEPVGDGQPRILEDEDVPSKSKASGKARLPPTGKISTNYKKKPLADVFVIPDVEMDENTGEDDGLDATPRKSASIKLEAKVNGNGAGLESSLEAHQSLNMEAAVSSQ
ncbi:LAMI_0E08856g1_1 [Lachancea mirantina]|uniref:SAGA complex subunit Spt7 n=1 Tax=Lachancea mirantina TaxID=1230905 RepID=A0A1G4JND7_9SACH|nr:LAMI_0E08856g1_1 [Lachancea mirantina]